MRREANGDTTLASFDELQTNSFDELQTGGFDDDEQAIGGMRREAA